MMAVLITSLSARVEVGMESFLRFHPVGCRVPVRVGWGQGLFFN